MATASEAASSERSTLIVAWEAPPECPSAEAVLLRLTDVVGVTASQLARRGEVHGQIRHESDRYVLELRIAGRAGGNKDSEAPRVLRATSCSNLTEAAAVAIALALGGEHIPSEPVATEEVEPEADGVTSRAQVIGAESARSEVSDTSAPTPPPAPGNARTLVLAARAEAVADSASLGATAFGPGVLVSARTGLVSLGAYGLWLPARRAEVARAQYADFALLGGGLRGCYWLGEEQLGLNICVGLELGSLRAQTVGLLEDRSQRNLWLAPAWGAELDWGILERLRVTARLEAVLPLARRDYVVDGTQLVGRVPDAAVRLALGLEAWLPLR